MTNHRSIPPCTLESLPEPPPGSSGWPWDEETPPACLQMPDGAPWPRISIVIPSYQQGRYIEETLRSILLQGYPNLELHVMDGGSRDSTVGVLEKYSPWISSWVSEKDEGQSDAINKGFALCSGEIFNWLCSDDFLMKGTLQKVARRFLKKPRVDVIAGACIFQYDDEPERSGVWKVEWQDWNSAPYSGVIYQPSCFFRRSLVSRLNLVRTDLHYCMDRELWAYLWAKRAVWEWSEEALSTFRFTGANKSTVGGKKVLDELDVIYRSYFEEMVPLPVMLRKWWLPLVQVSMAHPSGLVRCLSRWVSRIVTASLKFVYPPVRVRSLQQDFYHHGLECAEFTPQSGK